MIIGFSKRRQLKLKANRAQRQRISSGAQAKGCAPDRYGFSQNPAGLATVQLRANAERAAFREAPEFKDRSGQAYERAPRGFDPRGGFTIRRLDGRPVDLKRSARQARNATRAQRLGSTLNQHLG